MSTAHPVSHSFTTWKNGQPTSVNADERAVADIRTALLSEMGGSDRAGMFIDRTEVCVLLARHFTDVSGPWQFADPIPETAYPIAQQALGIVTAYYEAGHTGENIFLFGGLPALEVEDCDDYGSEFTHMYFNRGARLVAALNQGVLRHCLPA